MKAPVTLTTFLMEGLCGGGDVDARCPYLTENERKNEAFCAYRGEGENDREQPGFNLNYEDGIPFPRRRIYCPLGQGEVRITLTPANASLTFVSKPEEPPF